MRHGKGILYYKSGNVKYEGDFVNDKFEGDGKYYWESGEYYIGQFKNGLNNGKGKLYYNNDKLEYEGEFDFGGITLAKRGETAVWVTFKVDERYSLLEVNVEEEGTQNGHMKVIKLKKK